MKKSTVKIRAPRGFYFRITENKRDSCHEAFVRLYENKSRSEIGHIYLIKHDNKGFVTHSELDREFQGKKFGVKLYARAIQWCHENGHKVSSSGSSSEMATRVWAGKSIRQYFSLRKRKSRWGSDKWYAYVKA